jgi:predicted TIM-barrel fold metal-dependent hydrolase
MVQIDNVSGPVRQATPEEVANRPERRVTFLPEPPRAERTYLIFSADDHLCEPPDTFEGRIPQKYIERAPRVVDTADGGQAWLYDGRLVPNVGLNAVAGRPYREVTRDPARFDEMRKGTWNADARVRDMDLNGVYASINFPSELAGFGGARLQTIIDDEGLALAVVRAYNQWHHEVWAGSHPDRLIATQIPWLHDPVIGAQEIRSNAELGFKAVTFPESLDKLGFPSVFTDHWEPIMAACEDSGTVLCLHTGSGGGLPTTGTAGAPPDVTGLLFGMSAMMTAIDWLYSGYPVRHPGLKICLSEGGIGWVPAVLDRLAWAQRRGTRHPTCDDWDLTPSEVFRRNFWFCFLDEPTAIAARQRIGIDRIMFEVDYPHSDTNWPNSQEMLRRELEGVPADEVARLTWQNASELFRHPVPAGVQADYNRF